MLGTGPPSRTTIGRRYLSSATCLIRPHSFYASRAGIFGGGDRFSAAGYVYLSLSIYLSLSLYIYISLLLLLLQCLLLPEGRLGHPLGAEAMDWKRAVESSRIYIYIYISLSLYIYI